MNTDTGGGLKKKSDLIIVGQKLPPLENDTAQNGDDWIRANPEKIKRLLQDVQKKPSGGWFVLGERKKILKKNKTVLNIDGKEILVVRRGNSIHALSNICPHLGAPLSAGKMSCASITCPWHGLNIPYDDERHKNNYLLYNDGYLYWIQIPGNEEKTSVPFLPQRPEKGIAAVLETTLRCDPGHVIANRLDPWHGAHLHPHSFSRLKVYKENQDGLFLRVAFRVSGRICIEVDACFHCPEPRTIVMTIIEGEGKGSIVETHATPIAPGYTRLTELTIAYSSKKGFFYAKIFAPFIRSLIRSAARKLWREDAVYAERRFFLENQQPYALYLENKSKWPIGHP